LLFLPDSKSGRKTVILNAPALTVLHGLRQLGPYGVPGDDPESPRPDLKRPWDAITKRAGLVGVRLHDLRHTYASFGVGDGLGYNERRADQSVPALDCERPGALTTRSMIRIGCVA